MSTWFKLEEFKCPCNRPSCEANASGIDPAMVVKLNKVREQLGHPIHVTSGLRCQWYQKRLAIRGYKTAQKSPHVPGNYGNYGIAVDLSCKPEHFPELCRLVQEEFQCVGIGEHWCHVDLRADKKRLWFYNY